jgi:hypothetical protein
MTPSFAPVVPPCPADRLPVPPPVILTARPLAEALGVSRRSLTTWVQPPNLPLPLRGPGTALRAGAGVGGPAHAWAGSSGSFAFRRPFPWRRQRHLCGLLIPCNTTVKHSEAVISPTPPPRPRPTAGTAIHHHSATENREQLPAPAACDTQGSRTSRRTRTRTRTNRPTTPPRPGSTAGTAILHHSATENREQLPAPAACGTQGSRTSRRTRTRTNRPTTPPRPGSTAETAILHQTIKNHTLP